MAANNIGMIWLYGIVVLFVLGMIELLLIPAIEAKFVPEMVAASNSTLAADDVTGLANYSAQVITFIDTTIYVLMFAIVVYMVVMIFKREETVYQQ